jgi:hypothetical protein
MAIFPDNSREPDGDSNVDMADDANSDEDLDAGGHGTHVYGVPVAPNPQHARRAASAYAQNLWGPVSPGGASYDPGNTMHNPGTSEIQAQPHTSAPQGFIYTGAGKFTASQSVARHAHSHALTQQGHSYAELGQSSSSQLVAHNTQPSPGSPARGRPRSKCDQCRKSQIKCDCGRPCDQCLKRGRECTYLNVDSRSSRKPPPGPPPGQGEGSSDQGEQNQGVTYVYDATLPDKYYKQLTEDGKRLNISHDHNKKGEKQSKISAQKGPGISQKVGAAFQTAPDPKAHVETKPNKLLEHTGDGDSKDQLQTKKERKKPRKLEIRSGPKTNNSTNDLRIGSKVQPEKSASTSVGISEDKHIGVNKKQKGRELSDEIAVKKEKGENGVAKTQAHEAGKVTKKADLEKKLGDTPRKKAGLDTATATAKMKVEIAAAKTNAAADVIKHTGATSKAKSHVSSSVPAKATTKAPTKAATKEPAKVATKPLEKATAKSPARVVTRPPSKVITITPAQVTTKPLAKVAKKEVATKVATKKVAIKVPVKVLTKPPAKVTSKTPTSGTTTRKKV